MVGARKKNKMNDEFVPGEELLIEEESILDYEIDEEFIWEKSKKGVLVSYKNLPTYKASANWEEMWNITNLNETLPSWLLIAILKSQKTPFSGNIDEYICDKECHTKQFDVKLVRVSSKMVKIKHKIATKELQLYETTDLKESNLDKIYANAGGPVWSMAWCPKPDFPQYLAVYTHRSPIQLTYSSEKLHLKGTIQIWAFEKNNKFSLVMILFHEFGPIFEMKWMPLHSVSDNSLGLIAFCGCDEIVRIASIPAISSENQGSEIEYVELKILANLLPNPRNSTNGNLSLRHQLIGNALCIAWSPFQPYTKLVAGYSSGYICVWDLDNANLVNISSEVTNVHPRTIRHLYSTNVLGLEFCPHVKDLIVVNGIDKKIFFIDINAPDTNFSHITKYVARRLKWPKYCSEPYLLDLTLPANFRNGLRAAFLIPSADLNEDETAAQNNDIERRDRLFGYAIHFSDMSSCSYSGFIVATTFDGDCLVINKNLDYKAVKVGRRAESCVYTLSTIPAESATEATESTESCTVEMMDVNEIPAEKAAQLYQSTTEEWSRSIRKVYQSSINKGVVFNEFDRFYKNQKGANVVSKVINPIDSDKIFNYNSLNRVALNENICALGWVVTGGNAGILKIEELTDYLK